ncbi:MAG TPA: hypothetical protein VK427_10190, partial [Kofleriaceae bacterium]|nr:hypothetical protein [Kofleriaceae bacterium]
PATSLVLRRGLTGTQLAAGSWLAPPTGTPTRTGATWTTPAGATVFALAYAQGATKVLGVSVFDGSTSVTVPDLIAVPSGPLTVTLEAIGAPGLDVTSFSLDADRAKLATVASQTMQVN